MLNDLLLRQTGKTYVEDVFSTYLYNGTGAALTINNGLALNNGSMVWLKNRNGANDHALYDTARGATFDLTTTSTAAQTTQATGLTAFGSSGFTIGALAKLNNLSGTYVSWSFRKAPKFFDIVTYTGNGTVRTINHSLGTTPGMIIIKSRNGTGSWVVYHSSVGSSAYLTVESNLGQTSNATTWNATNPTASTFTVGSVANVNSSSVTYVAYLFAHDTTSDGMIQCGSYTGNGAATGPTITLGWEPQFLLVKRANTNAGGGRWWLADTARGIYDSNTSPALRADAVSAEASFVYWRMLPTGFQIISANSEINTAGDTFVYMAIRRGPMKVPTSGSQVLEIVARSGNSTTDTVVGSSITTDLAVTKIRNVNGGAVWLDRMRGAPYLTTSSAVVEANDTDVNPVNPFDVEVGFKVGAGTTTTTTNTTSNTYINYLLRRAPSFMDIVAYTGDGLQGKQINHNLGVTPEFIIIKQRDTTATNWYSWNNTQNGVNWWQYYMLLNGTNALTSYGGLVGLAAAPTSTLFSIGNSSLINTNGARYITYLFASIAGVIKIGTYTGNGSSLDVDCGFAAGARFVLVRRSNSTGSWYVFDTTRGITATGDPIIGLNNITAETTTVDSIDPLNAGFTVVQNVNYNINVSGGVYFFLAIA